MTKFVFINIPSTSHINPTLPIVQELVERGDEVSYYLTERFRQVVEETGATFHSFETNIEQINKTSFTSGKPVGLPMYMLDESLFVIPQILESIRAEQPDVIVYGTMCLTGRLIAEILQIPAVNFRMIFAFSKRLTQIFRANASQDPSGIEAFQASLHTLCSQYPVKPFRLESIFTHEEPLNLVTIPESFQIDRESLGDQYHFVGPAIAPRKQQSDFPFEQLEKQPVIYITQGTVYNDRADFFNLCFAAFADTHWKVVVSIGNNVDQSKLHPFPNNFIVRSYIPQLEVLAYTTVCINHAAMTTMMESFSQGVPLVVVAQKLADMDVNSSWVDELGLGIKLNDKDLTAELLRDTVTRVSDDPAFRMRARKLQEEIKNAGGYKRAADILQEYAIVHI
ncbi:glycosyl transferase [Ktedonobacteria bacterium brp13]|nr:glycosyl transferase [Ktedonobacteria bacterium brp13]